MVEEEFVTCLFICMADIGHYRELKKQLEKLITNSSLKLIEQNDPLADPKKIADFDDNENPQSQHAVSVDLYFLSNVQELIDTKMVTK